jgi:WD40 repeat protein
VRIDATRVATAGDDSVAIIWHMDMVRQGGILKGHTRPITSMVVLPSRSEPQMVTGSKDKTIKVWCLEDATIQASFSEADHSILCLLYLGNGLFCSAGTGICVWDTSGKLVGQYRSALVDAEDIQTVILVAPSRIAACSNDKTLVVYDLDGVLALATKEAIPSPTDHAGGLGGAAPALAISNAPASPASSPAPAPTAQTGLPGIQVAGILDKHREDVCCVHKISDAEFASGSLDGTVVIWSTDTLREIVVLNHRTVYQSPKTHKYVYSIQHLISFENFLVAAMGDGFVIYNMDTGLEVACVRQAHRTVVTHLLVMDNGEWLVTCSADAVIRLWGLSELNQRRRSSPERAGAGAAANLLVPGGGGGGSGGEDAWKVAPATPPRPAGTTRAASSSPSFFNRAAPAPSWSVSKPVPALPRLLGNLAVHSDRVNMLLACGGSEFLSCGSDQMVVLWRTDIIEWEKSNEISRTQLGLIST